MNLKALALAAVVATLAATPALPQTIVYYVGSDGQRVPVTPETPMPTTGSGGGGGGGGDASAANQTAVIGSKAGGTAAASSLLAGCVYNTSLPTLTSGQQAASQCDSSGLKYTRIGAALPAGTNNIGDVDVLTLPALPTGSNVIGAVTQSGTWNIGAITTVPTHAVTQSGTWNIGSITTLPALVASSANIGDVDVLTLPALPTGSNTIGAVTGPGAAALATSSNQSTTNTALGAPGDTACASGSVSCAIAPGIKALITAAQDTTPVAVKGGVAIDAAISDPPVLAGCRASSATPTAMSADNDVQAVRCDPNGNLISRQAPLGNAVSGVTSAITDSTSTQLLAAPGANLRNYLTHIACYNTDADTDTLVNVKDGNDGTIIYQLFAPFGGGSSLTLPFPLRQPTANTRLDVDPVTTGSSTTCVGSGFKE